MVSRQVQNESSGWLWRSAMPAMARWNACECRLTMPGVRQPSGVRAMVRCVVMRAFCTAGTDGACENAAMEPTPSTPPPMPPSGLAPLLSRAMWKRRLVLWGGAVVVALAALVFAHASDATFSLFRQVL